ncbi:MAG: hypothetical protein AB7I13_05925 [Vicinamibacterales bacterium]
MSGPSIFDIERERQEELWLREQEEREWPGEQDMPEEGFEEPVVEMRCRDCAWALGPGEFRVCAVCLEGYR